MSLFSLGQTSKNTFENKGLVTPSNTERYGIDYTILEWTQINESVALQIDLTSYENLRTDNTDVDIFLPEFNFTLRLYSKIQTLENEGKTRIPLNYFNQIYFKEE